MKNNLDRRLAALERHIEPEALRIERIIIVSKGGDPLDGFVMERQPDGTWHHRPITEQEATQ